MTLATGTQVWLVCLVCDGEVDPYTFDTEADANAFADAAQSWLGENGYALDYSVSPPLQTRTLSLEDAAAELLSGFGQEED